MKTKVLVIEDSRLQAEQTRVALEARGCEITITDHFHGDATGAFNMICRGMEFDVVMSDLNFPGKIGEDPELRFGTKFINFLFSAPKVWKRVLRFALVSDFNGHIHNSELNEDDNNRMLDIKHLGILAQCYLDEEKSKPMIGRSPFFWINKECADYPQLLDKTTGKIISSSEADLEKYEESKNRNRYTPIKPWGEIFDYMMKKI